MAAAKERRRRPALVARIGDPLQDLVEVALEARCSPVDPDLI